MKKGKHIIQTNKKSYGIERSTFAEDHTFGSYWAKPCYWKRDPIWILGDSFFAQLGTSFANNIYLAFEERVWNL